MRRKPSAWILEGHGAPAGPRKVFGPIEWTAIFIGTRTVATSLVTNLTNDLYAKAKQMLLDRKTKGGRPNKGFVIFGPDGKPLRRWDSQNGDHHDDES